MTQSHIFLLISVLEACWKSTSAKHRPVFFYETLFGVVLSCVLRAYSKANSLFPITFNRFFIWTLQLQTN